MTFHGLATLVRYDVDAYWRALVRLERSGELVWVDTAHCLPAAHGELCR